MRHEPQEQGPAPGFWRSRHAAGLFAFSFFKPATSRDWRSFGAFSAFVVARFGEAWERYAQRTPRFLPRWGQASPAGRVRDSD